MGKRLYVGNLSFSTNEESLKELFSAVGQIDSVKVIKDLETERSKGFGFVDMSTEEEAAKAIEELNEKEVDGRTIVVSYARERENRPPRRNYGGGNSGGGSRFNRGGNSGGGYNRF